VGDGIGKNSLKSGDLCAALQGKTVLTDKCLRLGPGALKWQTKMALDLAIGASQQL
jgi:hypothetical protein